MMKESEAAQTSLWQLDDAAGNGPTQLSVSFGEEVPVARLKEIWSRMTTAHPVLRSSFKRQGGGLMQNVHEVAEVPWRELDWSDVPGAEIGARWAAELAGDAGRPIDLSNAPVLRFLVIRLPGGATHMLVSYPRFLLDEEGWFYLLCEWIEGLDGHLVPSPGGASPAVPSDSAFWEKLLEGAAPRAVKVYGAGDAGEAVELNTLLDRGTTSDLNALADRLEVSVRDIVMGAWGVVISRLNLSGEALLLASCEAVGPLPGARANFLPARIRPELNLSFSQFLKALSSRERLRMANANIAVGRLPLKAADCAAAFAWLPPGLNDRIPEAFPRWINLDARVIQPPLHPLELEVRAGHRLALRLRTSQLPKPAAERVFSWFEQTLHDILADPGAKPGTMAFGEAEELPGPPRKPPVAPACIQDATSETAQQFSDNVAIEDGNGGALTCREVEEYATQLAAHLAADNLANGWNIAVCLSPSPWVPVAMLGVLRAGDTCVSLNPLRDSSWLTGQLEAADCELVVCDSSTREHFAGHGGRLLVIDQAWDSIRSASAQEEVKKPDYALLLPEPGLGVKSFSPSLLAAACNRSVRSMEIAAGDRLVVCAPAGTAAYCEAIFCAMLTGATAVFVNELSPKVLDAIHPTHLRLTDAEFRALVAAYRSEGSQPPASLKCVAVDNADGFTATSTLLCWQEMAPHVRWIHFLSPCGFVGIGLRYVADDLTGAVELPEFIPAGEPTRSCGFSFADPAGQAPPCGFPGNASFDPLYGGGRTEPRAMWRDGQGQFHCVLPEDIAPVLCAVPGVWDAAASPEDEVAWYVGSISETELQSALSSSVRFRLVRVPFLPFSGGRVDFEALAGPAEPAKPLVPAESPRGKAVEQKPEARAEGGAVPSPTPPPKPRPAALLTPLGGGHNSPQLLIIVPDSVDSCRTLAGELSDEWNVFATVASGDPEAPASRLASALPSQGPHHLIGIGEAGMVAWELARILRSSGHDVPFLVIAGTPPPARDRGWLGSFTRSLRGESSSYRARPMQGPCGIVITPDLPPHSGDHWLELAPDAIVENLPCPPKELTGTFAPRFKALLMSLSGADI